MVRQDQDHSDRQEDSALPEAVLCGSLVRGLRHKVLERRLLASFSNEVRLRRLAADQALEARLR